MRKAMSLALCLLVIFVFSACDLPVTEETQSPLVSPLPISTVTPEIATTSTPVTTQLPTPTASLTIAPTAVPTTAPVSPPPGPLIYSSYAYLVSFDTTSGIAQFDYFDPLKGTEAIDWLVNNEGYALSDAQELVNNFADPEFVVKNTNPQLRSIDLCAVPVKMLDYPFGYDLAPDPDPLLTSFADICSIYAIDPYLVLTASNGLYYYYITVNSDNSVEVTQMYTP